MPSDLHSNRFGDLTAEKVFGWKCLYKHDGELIGKKQDKAGRWRSVKVPGSSYSTTLPAAHRP